VAEERVARRLLAKQPLVLYDILYIYKLITTHSMDKQITIYSTPTCHFCHMTKEFLTAHNIPFTDHNVAEDVEKRQEMMQKSGQMGVPVIFIGDEMIIGFDKARISELLDIKE